MKMIPGVTGVFFPDGEREVREPELPEARTHFESRKIYLESIGKTLQRVRLCNADDGSAIIFHFTDGTALVLDDDQQCCEERFFHSDDGIGDFIFSEFRGVALRSVTNVRDDEGDREEVAFLVVMTNRGEFVIEAHNKHNGYYSGFNIGAPEKGSRAYEYWLAQR